MAVACGQSNCSCPWAFACRESALGWKLGIDYVLQDIIKARALTTVPTRETLIKILERHAVALRCEKGASMSRPLKLRRTLTEGNATAEKLEAAVDIVVMKEVTDITRVGPGLGEIGGIDDIYERKAEDYGDDEERFPRVLTHGEVSELQLPAPAAAAPAAAAAAPGS